MASSSTSQPSILLLSKAQADRLKELEAGDFDAIVKLASHGLRGESMLDYVEKVADDESPPLPSKNTSPKPITIVAKSFVKDRGQYAGTYGLTGSQAGELADLLEVDPNECASRIEKIVLGAVRKKGSPKAVRVILGDAPSAGKPEGTAPPKGDGGLKQLKSVIRDNSGVYGSYRFEAVDTKNEGNHAFRVRLGGSLYVFAQSKDLAKAAARIVRVKGRHDPMVRGFVAYWNEGAAPKFMRDIPDKVAFDGRLGPGDALPADVAAKPKTESPAR